ncbi:MAG: DNA-3-methyladenine glycosylase I [Actinobacteria bacterium]|nr:DNA-3-methyladenine glycosylase I [Actinomycetota bacterium]
MKDEPRCGWSLGSESMRRYHDQEWGFPVGGDVALFEKISLEGFQSGLSWRTVLDKRGDLRRVFHGFDVDRVARMCERDVERLLGDASIIRHRGKVESTINNARRCLELVEVKGSLASHVWSFEPPRRREAPTRAEVATLVTSAESVALAKDLKKRGWSFVGPTTMYALMQSVGIVNDHDDGCHVWGVAEKARKRFRID